MKRITQANYGRATYNKQCTQYFLATRERTDWAVISLEWIERVCQYPEKEEIQADSRIRRWALIPETGRYLRVVLLEDVETVHNAFLTGHLNHKSYGD